MKFRGWARAVLFAGLLESARRLDAQAQVLAAQCGLPRRGLSVTQDDIDRVPALVDEHWGPRDVVEWHR